MNIILVDDHLLFIEGLKNMIEQASETFSVKRIFNDSRKVLNYLNSEKVDIILTDLNMPYLSGIDLMKVVKANFPRIRIVVMSMYSTPQLVRDIQGLGADGMVLKTVDSDYLTGVLKKVGNGERCFSNLRLSENTAETVLPMVTDSFLVRYSLSSREFEIFKMIVENYTSAQIAETLFISLQTVSSHRKSIIRKTGCSTPLEMHKLWSSMPDSSKC